MNEYKELLKRMQFINKFPKCTERFLLFERLLGTDMNEISRNNSEFSIEEVDKLISSMNIDISLLKEKYKDNCNEENIGFDEPNFYSMINVKYPKKRSPNVVLLKTLKELLFDISKGEAYAIKEIQAISEAEFRIICDKIKHCLLVSKLKSMRLVFCTNDEGNEIIAKKFQEFEDESEDKLEDKSEPECCKYWRELYIQQYRKNKQFCVDENCFYEGWNQEYEDYIREEVEDLFPTISIDDYYTFEKEICNIALYKKDISGLPLEDKWKYFEECDKFVTTWRHDIYRLPLEKLVWLEEYGIVNIMNSEPVFLHILFQLLFTAREDRNNIVFTRINSSLKIPKECMNDYMNEIQKMIDFPMIAELCLDESYYSRDKLSQFIHRTFFLKQPTWVKFLVLKFDNSHLRAAKYLYYELYIQRMHLKRNNEETILLELKKCGLSYDDINKISKIYENKPIRKGLGLG